MKFIRKHKFTTFTIIMLLVIFILMFSLIRFLVPNYDSDGYGNRLKGIENYKIEDKTINELKDKIGQNESVVSVDYLLTGRLIDITLVVKDEVEKDAAKAIAGECLPYFTDEQKKYYDIQILVKSENEESEKYPVIGYKHKTNEALIWSNN